jgi:hypothetical protein
VSDGHLQTSTYSLLCVVVALSLSSIKKHPLSFFSANGWWWNEKKRNGSYVMLCKYVNEVLNGKIDLLLNYFLSKISRDFATFVSKYF